MESKRGRPSGKLLNKYSFDLDKISNYFKENVKEEQTQPQTQQEQAQTQEEQKPQPEQPTQPEQTKSQQEHRSRVIVFDKSMLIKADILVSAILESGLDFIGLKKEILPMDDREADFLIEIMPAIQLEKNWTNFFIAYILLKITK
jgi:hypothetical protein